MFALKPGQLKILSESQIPVIAPRAGDRILPQVPKHARFIVRAQLRYRYLPQVCRVKPRRCRTELGIIRRTLLHLEFANRVAQHIASDSTRHPRNATCCCDRRALAENCYPVELPSTDRGTDKVI